MKPNPLLIISIVFAASFCGRAITIASAATHARAETAPPAEQHTAEQQDNAPSSKAGGEDNRKTEEQHAEAAIEAAVAEIDPREPPKPAAPELPSKLAPALPDADEGALLAAIKERAAMLDKREADLADRARLLSVVEKRVDEKTKKLAALKDELEKRLSFASTASQKDIEQLAQMYEAMKPNRAGEIFNAMDPTFAAGFLTQMDSDAAALILANMDTQKAYATSIIIAGRNAGVNK